MSGWYKSPYCLLLLRQIQYFTICQHYGTKLLHNTSIIKKKDEKYTQILNEDQQDKPNS
jgi:hypothetical protein